MWPVMQYPCICTRQADALFASELQRCGEPSAGEVRHAARLALEHALGLAELTHGEIRVLRYLPTHLSAREIAAELYVSMNTVKTHQRHLYEKLGAHSRTQAVERARALGLLTPPVGGGQHA